MCVEETCNNATTTTKGNTLLLKVKCPFMPIFHIELFSVKQIQNKNIYNIERKQKWTQDMAINILKNGIFIKNKYSHERPIIRLALQEVQSQMHSKTRPEPQ